MDNKSQIRNFFVKNSKFLFPVIVIIVAAVTVSFALNANRNKAEQESGAPSSEEAVAPVNLAEERSEEVPQETQTPKETPLIPNENEGIQAIVAAYYNSMQLGDSAGMAALYDKLTEEEMLRCEEMAKYVSYISNLEVYTKEGPEAGVTVAYVYYKICFLNHEEEVPGWQTFYLCDNGQGGLYIKNEKNLTEEEKQYVGDISGQDDVVELNNRVNVEYRELMEANPQLLSYLGELGNQVDIAVGVRLAEQVASSEPAQGDNTVPAEGSEQGTEGTQTPDPNTEAQTGPQSAVATTTVNVRK